MSEEESEGPTEIEDIENYTEERRLKSIFDIREQIHTMRQEVRVAAQDKQKRFEALCVYRALVDSYLMELEPLLRRYGDGEYYLREKDFGTIEIEPKVEQAKVGRYGMETRLYFPEKGEWKKVDHRSIPEPDNIHLKGLESLFNIPDPITISTSVQKPGRPDLSMRDSNTYQYRWKIQIPLQKLDTMLRTLNNFLSEIGFELEPEEEDDPAHIGV